ncbi:MAG: polysaccharide biosynthesis protein, partial [Bacteroidota bacterium]
MSIKKLASETAIYGVSSILGRILNFALVPLYTQLLPPDDYSVVIELYALIAFVMVFFTYRIEVAYFRFGTDKTLNRKTTFNTALSSLFVSTVILGLLSTFLVPAYATNENLQAFQAYIYLCVGIICLDTLCELPYAELRLSGRPIRFATIRLANIFTNLGLNLFFLKVCPWILEHESLVTLHPIVSNIYSPDVGIGYIFIANFVASCLSFVLLSP